MLTSDHHPGGRWLIRGPLGACAWGRGRPSGATGKGHFRR